MILWPFPVNFELAAGRGPVMEQQNVTAGQIDRCARTLEIVVFQTFYHLNCETIRHSFSARSEVCPDSCPSY